MARDFILASWLIIGLLGGCQTKKEANNQGARPKYDKANTAIIPWEPGYPFDSLTYQRTTLSPFDIELVEDLLVAAVIDYNQSLAMQYQEHKITAGINDYKKQLVAVVNSKGEKEVWVNCLCAVDGDSWRNEIIVVHDGGPCFFNLKINLRTRKVYEMVVNGFA